MKVCDMCAPRTSGADTYELRFDKLPTQDCDVPEHLSKWTGELCPMHADMVRNTLKAGPPTESNANPWDPHRECAAVDASQPGPSMFAAADVQLLDLVAETMDVMPEATTCAAGWQEVPARLRGLAARMRLINRERHWGREAEAQVAESIADNLDAGGTSDVCLRSSVERLRIMAKRLRGEP